MKTIKEQIKNHLASLFGIFDIILIIFASFLSFLLRFDGQIPSAKFDNFFAFTALAVLATPIIFYFFGLYEISWSYVSLTDIPTIGKGVIVSTLFLGTLLYLFRFYPSYAEFPRSVIFIYGLLLFFLVSGLRFSKRIYWQLVHNRKEASKVQDDFNLPLISKISNGDKPKNILVTGGAGYIGTVLIRQLLEANYNITVVDKLLFGEKPIKELGSFSNFRFIRGDILDAETMIEALFDIDTVINLAAIVGEPACMVEQDIAFRINYLGTIYLARLCKTFGIRRFVQASTCSTYGQQNNKGIVQEIDRLFPVDFYGETKIYTERELIKLADENFNPTILRFSTVYGLSPRMRFDLVVNTLTKKAVKDKKIFIFGGNQWRPVIHVSDLARAIALVVEAPLSKVGNQIFNVGNTTENYLISEIGELVRRHIPDVQLESMRGMDDKRSYKVDFHKIEKFLNFKTQKKVEDGIIEIRDAIKNGYFPNPEDKIYYNHLA